MGAASSSDEPAGVTPDQAPLQADEGQADAAPTGSAAAPGAPRLDNLDFIRGLAVMGILVPNIIGFGQPMDALLYPAAFLVPHGATSDALWVAQFVLFDGKMRALFTMLFGAGMWLFLEKAWARGAGIGLQARRLAWLLGFGAVHHYLIWTGDILMLYALCGFVVLPMVRMRPGQQILAALVVYALGILIGAAATIPVWLAKTGAQPAQDMTGLDAMLARQAADSARETALIQQGRWGDLVAHTVGQHGMDPFTNALFVAFETIPLMLIGMALYRLGLFSGGFIRARQLGWGWAAIAIGAALSLWAALWSWRQGLGIWDTQVAFLALAPVPRLLMGVGLLAVLAIYGKDASGWLGVRVRAAGRVAFTNYLGTSVVMMLVFQGWAGGLYGVLSRPALYAVAAVGCALMLAWSAPWLARFRFGPLEWLWRCLTYGRVFAIRRVRNPSAR